MRKTLSNVFSITASVIGLSVLLSPGVSFGQGIAAAMGKAEYQRSCASCHGMEGLGDGPMAAHLNVQPTNLQTIGEKYSSDALYKIIDGRQTVRAHGTSEMPVWGDAYVGIAKEMGGERKDPERIVIEQNINGRILSLIYYIQSMQK